MALIKLITINNQEIFLTLITYFFLIIMKNIEFIDKKKKQKITEQDNTEKIG